MVEGLADGAEMESGTLDIGGGPDGAETESGTLAPLLMKLSAQSWPGPQPLFLLSASQVLDQVPFPTGREAE